MQLEKQNAEVQTDNLVKDEFNTSACVISNNLNNTGHTLNKSTNINTISDDYNNSKQNKNLEAEEMQGQNVYRDNSNTGINANESKLEKDLLF